MCIAIASLKGTPIPKDDILRNCFKNNPDGAGFAYNDRGQVVIRKGFMDVDSFLNALHQIDKEIGLTDRGVLLHTRITTHGGTNPSMCHPFPIVADEGALKKIVYRSSYAVIHNGIISMTSAEANLKKDMSDTAVFIEKYLTKIATNKKWFNNKANIELIEDLIDSKMAILNSNGDIIMTSGFTKDEEDGIYYSNTSYQDNYSKYIRKYYKPYDYYDDEFWGYGGYKSSKYSEYEDNLRKQGYEKTANGCWVKKDKKKESEKDIENLVPLMKLKPDEVLITYSDGNAEEYCSEIEYYSTLEGEIYYSNEPTYKTILDTPLQFYDYGEFYTNTFSPIEFREDVYINEDLLNDEVTVD